MAEPKFRQAALAPFELHRSALKSVGIFGSHGDDSIECRGAVERAYRARNHVNLLHVEL